MKQEPVIGKIMIYFIILHFYIICLFPLYWMLRTALVGNGEDVWSVTTS